MNFFASTGGIRAPVFHVLILAAIIARAGIFGFLRYYIVEPMGSPDI
jgi:hypothetical protein